jgi:hypothetical protein
MNDHSEREQRTAEQRTQAKELLERLETLKQEHAGVYADSGVSPGLTDRLLARADLPQEARSQIESELSAAADAARNEAFEEAREARGHKHPRSMNRMV